MSAASAFMSIQQEFFMPFSLTISQIRSHCGSAYYQRGLRYQRQGRVLDVTLDAAARQIQGKVAGSQNKVYTQKISFTPAQRQRLLSTCSCPMRSNCKHVAAVLLEWIERNLETFEQRCNPDPSLLQRWQQQTGQILSAATTREQPSSGDACLLYVLDFQGQGLDRKLCVKALKSRRLKRGGWGTASAYNLTELSPYYAPAGALPLDHEIARLLYRRDVFSHVPLQLEGDVGLLVLQRLVQSKRCFWQTINQQPLQAGPLRPASFTWLRDEQLTRLQIGLEGCDNWRLLPTSPVWYLDLDQHQCGPIEQPLSAELFRALHNLPPIDEGQLVDFSRFLFQAIPPRSIPLPVELKINRWDQPPTPRLILHGVRGPHGARYHLARCRFDYGPVSLPPLAAPDPLSCLVAHNGEDWQIERRPQIEAQSLQVLGAHHLVPAPRNLRKEAAADYYFSTTSLADSAAAWQRFLAQIPTLEEQGWLIEIDPSFELSFEVADRLVADIDASEHDWFAVGLNIEHDGHKISLLPLLVQWLENHDPQQPLFYRLAGSRWLEIPVAILEPVVGTLVELFQDPQLNGSGQLKLPRPLAHGLLDLEDHLTAGGCKFAWNGGAQVRQLAQKLKDFRGIEAAALPAGLVAELRPYQHQGLSWLQFLREYGFHGVLADDMGLGKTIQALAHLQLEKEAGRLTRPALIVAPTSVLSNWLREAQRFTPSLKTLVLHGPERNKHFQALADYDLIITSYALLTRDIKVLSKHRFHTLVLDEAQAIKNPLAKSTQAACAIAADHRLCLSGTPLENHLGELWSLFHFLMPGYLGSRQKFTQLFRTPIEKQQNLQRQQQLQQRVAPFVLRRDKAQVVQELPLKTLMIREVELNPGQSKLYEGLRLAMTDKVGKLLQEKGLKKSHIEILDALLKLRQVCCDPRLVKLEAARKVKHSAKLEALLDMLDELLAEGRKILVFSQFTSMLALIEAELQARNIHYSKLTGQTRKRDAAIAAFQDGEAAVFLISLKAGGVGLNLTAADTVIHYDPWWNPAVENQATDRAHRIGQDKPVFVYKLVARGTLEEKILQMQAKKQLLADGVYRQGKDKTQALPGLSSEDILALLKPVESVAHEESARFS
jgi:superfamily II DNA or RNA helicase